MDSATIPDDTTSRVVLSAYCLFIAVAAEDSDDSAVEDDDEEEDEDEKDEGTADESVPLSGSEATAIVTATAIDVLVEPSTRCTRKLERESDPVNIIGMFELITDLLFCCCCCCCCCCWRGMREVTSDRCWTCLLEHLGTVTNTPRGSL